MNTENENIEDELLSKKTPCQTIIEVEGERILKNKIKYRSEAVAERAANKHNFKKDTTEMVNAYECSECGQWHIGRNGKELDKAVKARLIEEKIQFKVVGKIDLSKFDPKVRKEELDKKREEEAKREKKREKRSRINEIKQQIKKQKPSKINLEDLKKLGGDTAASE